MVHSIVKKESVADNDAINGSNRTVFRKGFKCYVETVIGVEGSIMVFVHIRIESERRTDGRV